MTQANRKTRASWLRGGEASFGSRSRFMGRAALTLACALGLLEGASFLVLRMTGEWPKGRLRESFERHLKDPPPGMASWIEEFIPHPYFGFRHFGAGGNAGDINNFGFAGTVDFPYEKGPDDFVIGVFGASVAEGFGARAQKLGYLSDLPERVPRLKGKRIVVLNLSLPGGKQPQQFFIASYFLGMVDLFLNLDGFNDVIWREGRYPASFPHMYHYIYGPGRLGLGERLLSSFVQGLDRLTTRAALAIPLLSQSRGFFLFWRGELQLEKGVLETIARRSETRTDTDHPYFKQPETAGRAFEELLGNWERYSELEQLVVRAAGKKAVFFLQPNQYVSPSKPFSNEERPYVLAHPLVPGLRPTIEERFDGLRRRGAMLRKKGLLVFDLTDAFKDTRETVYLDNAGHINVFGERILAERIKRALAESASRIF